jgi:hypothetical protein
MFDDTYFFNIQLQNCVVWTVPSFERLPYGYDHLCTLLRNFCGKISEYKYIYYYDAKFNFCSLVRFLYIGTRKDIFTIYQVYNRIHNYMYLHHSIILFIQIFYFYKVLSCCRIPIKEMIVH